MGQIDCHRLPELFDILEAFGHTVEGLRQLTHLVVGRNRDSIGVVARRDLPRDISHPGKGG